MFFSWGFLLSYFFPGEVDWRVEKCYKIRKKIKKPAKAKSKHPPKKNQQKKKTMTKTSKQTKQNNPQIPKPTKYKHYLFLIFVYLQNMEGLQVFSSTLQITETWIIFLNTTYLERKHNETRQRVVSPNILAITIERSLESNRNTFLIIVMFLYCSMTKSYHERHAKALFINLHLKTATRPLL